MNDLHTAPLLNVPVDCDQARDLLPAYALRIADAEEARVVQAALAQCPGLMEELSDYGRLAAWMLHDQPLASPPTRLKARILSAVTSGNAQPSAQIALWKQWFVAAAALLVLSNVLWFIQWSRERVLPQGGVVNAPQAGFRYIPLAATAPSDPDTLHVALLWNESAQTVVLIAENLPPLPDGSAYQLWLQQGESRRSAGVFMPDAYGKGSLFFRVQEPLTAFTGTGITAEPSTGSETPTSSPIAVGEL